MVGDEESGQEKRILPEKPLFVYPDKIRIPDVSFLTHVELPDALDLQDQHSVRSILGSLVLEEMSINPEYRGMFVYGSIAHGEANNGSDIDGVHVVNTEDIVKAEEYAQPMQSRLGAVLEYCYRITVNDKRTVINLRGSPLTIRHSSREFDRQTITLGLSDEEIEVVRQLTGYQLREPRGVRSFKKPSMEIGPHEFIYPEDGVFPWYVEYGLLERLSR